MLCGASLGARQKPNFSGRWVMVSPEKGAKQVVAVDEKTMTVQRPDGTKKTVYQLDGVERRMALPSASITLMAAAKWDGNHILITRNTSYPNNMRTVSKDVWSIDGQGRLVIDSTETGNSGAPQVAKLIFTKK
jgi:hypothetical protein